MGEEVRRPRVEGIGTKPTTGKPSPRTHVVRANAGTKPTTQKPQGHPRKPGSEPNDKD